MSAWTCRHTDGKVVQKIVPPRPRIPWWKGPGADSEEKHEPASDIDTALVDSLKVLDPKGPIREADINALESITRLIAGSLRFFTLRAERSGRLGPPARPRSNGHHCFRSGETASETRSCKEGVSAGTASCSSEAATQFPAHNLVLLTVPTSLQPIGSFGFARAASFLPSLIDHASASARSAARTASCTRSRAYWARIFAPMIRPPKMTSRFLVLMAGVITAAIATPRNATRIRRQKFPAYTNNPCSGAFGLRSVTSSPPRSDQQASADDAERAERPPRPPDSADVHVPRVDKHA